MFFCEYFLDSASGRRMTRTRHPAHDAGSRRGQARHSFTGSLPVFTSCSIPTLRLLSGFRVGAQNDKNASPRTSMRGPEENKRDIHLQGLCRYLPHAVFPLCGYSLDSASKRGMTTYEKELQLPEALFVARPGYDPGTFPILYRDALTLRYQLLDIYSTLLILYLSLPSHGGPFLRIGFAIHQFPRPAASGTRRSSRIVLRQASGYIVSITHIVSVTSARIKNINVIHLSVKKMPHFGVRQLLCFVARPGYDPGTS